MNVLLSAYACAPGKGSEPQIGWNWARAISAEHQTWVLTRRRHQKTIEAALDRHPLPNARFVYVDLPRWARAWKDLPGGVYVYYLLWQIMAYRRMARLAREVSFDVVHHVTFCMFWMPTLLPLLNVPFIWGPLGGGESAPGPMRRDLPLSGRIFERLRDAGQWLALFNPLIRMAARRSVLALAGTPETAQWLRKLGCRDVEIIPVVGVAAGDLDEFHPLSRHQDPSPMLRVFSAGRLLHWKGYHLALRALASLGEIDFEYSIFGDGPERSRLQRLATSLGIADKVVFKTGIPRSQLLAEMPRFDALLHPSLHDSGGFVCLEAMASGCPVICLDLGGPAVQVDDGKTGIRIQATEPSQTVADMAQTLRSFHQNPASRNRMAAACRPHVDRHLSFSGYMEKLSRVYTPQLVEKAL